MPAKAHQSISVGPAGWPAWRITARFGQLFRIHPCRASITLSRRGLTQRFVRAFFVILAPKLFKGSLLFLEVLLRRPGGGFFERAMHPLMPPILFGMRRLDPF